MEDQVSELMKAATSLDGLRDYLETTYRANKGFFQTTIESRRGWCETGFDLAMGLAQGRERFDDNQSFGRWLDETELRELNKNDRAALINMAAHPAKLRRVLEETTRFSWRYIWEEDMRPFVDAPDSESRLPHVGNTPEPESSSPEVAESGPQSNKTKQTAKGMPKNFRNRPRADLVASIYGAKARWAIGKVLSKRSVANKAWGILLQAIDAGFVTAENAPNTDVPSARLLFAGAPVAMSRYKLDHPKDVETLCEMMPLAIAQRDAILAAPAQMETIIRDHRRQIVTETKLATAKDSMPASENEVVMFGRHFWPRVTDDFVYEYRHLQTAVFFFEDIRRPLDEKHGQESVPNVIRHTNKWLLHFAQTMNQRESQIVHGLVVELSRAMEKTPNATDNKLPKRPSMETVE
jgi:hypothetical protein